MLRTNLSTRPFYNLRAVQLMLGALAVLVIAVTVFNAIQIVRLTASQRTLGAKASEAEAEAVRLRREATRISSQIDPTELETVAAAAREANAIIDRRAFSWTTLWEQLERTLPADVRIVSVRPRVETDGSMIVGISVQARRAEDLDAFIQALELTGGFRNVLSIREQTSDEGLIESIVEGGYTQQPRDAAPAEDKPSEDRPAEGAARE
jgi:hypothetical protein